MMKVVNVRSYYRNISKGWDLNNTTTPYFDDEEYYVKKIKLYDPLVFLKIQYDMSNKQLSFKDWTTQLFDYKLEKIVKGLNSKKPVVPVPFIEFDKNNNIINYQEGKHRGIVALKRGEKIPVMEVYRK
jgi:hypothetical protein